MSIVTTIQQLTREYTFDYLWALTYTELEDVRDNAIITYNNQLQTKGYNIMKTTNTERVQDYINECINAGGLFAIEHEADCKYSIGTTFEALIDDFSYQHAEPTQVECKYLLDSLSNYCLSDNDANFYDNVKAAISEVLECM